MNNLKVFEAPFKGLSLVEASAGTGKTYNITSLYIRAIIEKNFEPSNILVLTYTEAATAELKERIRNRIVECIEFLQSNEPSTDDFMDQLKSFDTDHTIDKLKEALFSFDEASILTIHGFCQRLLRENSLLFGVQPDFEILQDTSELVQDAIDTFWRKSVEDYSRTSEGRNIFNYLLSQKITPDKLKKVVERALSKPYAKIHPQFSSSNKADEKVDKIKALKSEIKAKWEHQKDALNSVVFSGKLNKGSYKPDVFKEKWIELEHWVNNLDNLLTGFNKLENFGEEKIKSSLNKGKEVNIPEISVSIDTFLSEISDLSVIKAGFIKSAIIESEKNISFRKEKKNALSFDDLLQKVADKLDAKLAMKIAKQYPLALVDEFQDTDPIQYSIFKKIYSQTNTSLFMIGDPKQAIYSFRGADLFTYFNAINDVEDDQKYSLVHNYRSSEAMLNAINSVFERLKTPFVFDQPLYRTAEYPSGTKSKIFNKNGKQEPPLAFVDCEIVDQNKDISTQEVCNYVANQIDNLLTDDFKIDHDYVEPKDICVLVRTKIEAAQIQYALSARNIQSITKSNLSIFNTLECNELLILLKAISDHSNLELVRAALTTEYIAYHAEDIISLNQNEAKVSQVSQSFKEANEAWGKFGVQKAFNILDETFNIKQNIASFSNPERRLTNLYHLLELISSHENKNKATGSSVLKYINEKMNDSSVPGDEELIRLESDSDLVTITTLHSSKGLEYPVVLIPFLWDEFERKNYQELPILEYHNSSNELVIDVVPDKTGEIVEQARREQLADALRLAYVALTRAEAACFIPFTTYKGIVNSQLFALVAGWEGVLSKVKSKDELLDIFYTDLRNLSSNGDIRFTTGKEILSNKSPRPGFEKTYDLFSQKNLNVKSFSRSDLEKFSRIVSFSSLTGSSNSKAESVKDYDQVDFETTDEQGDDNLEILSKYSFPKGSGPGNLLHNIFEYITFDSNDSHESVIKDQCEAFGIDEKWIPMLEGWIEESLTHKIKDDISLKELSEQDVLKELEFHFPVNKISGNDIINIIRSNSNQSITDAFSISGFMKGFIDLIFRHNGKYYILDYKSNYLGDNQEAYSSSELKDKIFSSNFDIQYHIYTIALKKYLEQRVSGFSYETDFGGVFYVFLRGIETNKKHSGVYFDKPSLETIDRLETYFKQANHE